MKLLKELCEAPGIPGREQVIIDIMTRELKQICDSVTVDKMGNVIGKRKSDSSDPLKIMLAGHMDEIGFIVSHIDKNGFIRFAPRGGHNPRVLVSQRVRVYGKERMLIGVVEGAPGFLAPPEARNKVPQLKDLFVDTGLDGEEVIKHISIGDFIVLDRDFIEQDDICISKAFDNRVACYVIIETMKKLKTRKAEVYGVGTVQEEVGIRGAYTAAKDIEPDFGIAIDVTAAFDTPGVSEHQQVSQLGKGIAIKINDSSSISNHGVVEFLKKLAEEKKIPYQLEILPFGGTDAAAIQRNGKGPVCTLSIPTRYVHSPNEMLAKKDVEAGINLLVEFIEQVEDCQLKF